MIVKNTISKNITSTNDKTSYLGIKKNEARKEHRI